MERESTTDKAFYLFAGIAAFFTVGTNLYIHLTDFTVENFEEKILLYQSKSYIANRLIIILHCILIIISTIGMGFLLRKYSKEFATLGMVSFTVYGLTEICRILFSLNYVNRLRESYFTESNPKVKEFYSFLLNNTSFVNNIFFRLFIVAFAFGLLWYALALFKANLRADKTFGCLILFLSIITFIAFANDLYQNKLIGESVHWVSITLQPLIMLWMGIWVIKNGTGLSILKR